jgi:hypothetical protein
MGALLALRCLVWSKTIPAAELDSSAREMNAQLEGRAQPQGIAFATRASRSFSPIEIHIG